MTSREPHGSTLSAHRAFVVHLGAAGRPGRRRFTGQVEHLSSGRSAHFSSLKELLAFLVGILDASPPDTFVADHASNQKRSRRAPHELTPE